MSWGISNFENDAALAWVNDLINDKSASLLKETVMSFLENFDPEDTDIDQCSRFLAACETFAALVGNPPEEMPIELEDWIEKKYTQLEVSIFKNCVTGIDLILKESEIRALYEDSGYLKSWIKNQEDLIKRLSV
jgi:hypothetical protein